MAVGFNIRPEPFEFEAESEWGDGGQREASFLFQ